MKWSPFPPRGVKRVGASSVASRLCAEQGRKPHEDIVKHAGYRIERKPRTEVREKRLGRFGRQFCGFPSQDAARNFTDVVKSAVFDLTSHNPKVARSNRAPA